MDLLLDTHTFLWAALDDPKLSTLARELIVDTDNARWLSIASLWEIAIKVQIGKLEIGQPLATFFPEQFTALEISILPMNVEHTVYVSTLKHGTFANGKEHHDPFDRIIIAQSIVNAIPIVGIDVVFDDYGVDRSRLRHRDLYVFALCRDDLVGNVYHSSNEQQV